MGSVFLVYASQGRENYVELNLPASDYEMLDMMERLRLEPDQLPYVEVLKFRTDYDYLERCLHEQPDIYQLNALARKLSELTSVQELAAFEGLVGKEIAAAIEIPRLIDFAHSADCCVVAEDAATDFQLGKFLVKNGFIEEANGLPDSMLALLDYAKIGREHRKTGGGVYTGYGYVEQQSEVHCASKNMDFQPKKPEYTILLNMAAMPLNGGGRKAEVAQLCLPASEEQMRETLETLGVTGFLYNPACTAVQAEPAVTEIPGTKHTEKKIDSSFFSVTGFAEGKVKDRSQYKEGDPEYAVVTNDVEFLEALMGAKNNLIEVIELRNNIYLGWNELSAEAKEAYGGSLIAAYKDSTLEKGAPVSNPSMVESGVSQVTISNTDSLTIFSENGNNIEHAEFKVEGVNDLIIRNINFYNVWDWDDQRTSGYGTKGDMGTTKRTGWSYVKLNHAKNGRYRVCQ